MILRGTFIVSLIECRHEHYNISINGGALSSNSVWVFGKTFDLIEVRTEMRLNLIRWVSQEKYLKESESVFIFLFCLPTQINY